MAALAFWSDRFENEHRSRLEFDVNPEFGVCHGPDAVGCAFLVANNPTRDVPAGPVVLVIAPRKECAEVFVLDQEIDVDQRCGAADKQKYGLGQAGMRIADGTFKRSDRFVVGGHSSFTRIACARCEGKLACDERTPEHAYDFCRLKRYNPCTTTLFAQT
jgi:hypothetical protein